MPAPRPGPPLSSMGADPGCIRHGPAPGAVVPGKRRTACKIQLNPAGSCKLCDAFPRGAVPVRTKTAAPCALQRRGLLQRRCPARSFGGAFQRTSSAFQPCCVTQPTPFRPPAFTKTFSARNKAATGAKQRGRIVMRMPRGRLRQRVSCGAVACACEYPPRRNPAQTARCGEAPRGLAFSPALPPAARCQEGTPWLTSRAVSATWFSPTMP